MSANETSATAMPAAASTAGLAGATALVTGASRGFGRAIAAALCASGATVIGVARHRSGLEEVRATLGEAFTPVPADVTDPTVAGQLYR